MVRETVDTEHEFRIGGGKGGVGREEVGAVGVEGGGPPEHRRGGAVTREEGRARLFASSPGVTETTPLAGTVGVDMVGTFHRKNKNTSVV